MFSSDFINHSSIQVKVAEWLQPASDATGQEAEYNLDRSPEATSYTEREKIIHTYDQLRITKLPKTYVYQEKQPHRHSENMQLHRERPQLSNEPRPFLLCKNLHHHDTQWLCLKFPLLFLQLLFCHTIQALFVHIHKQVTATTVD